MEEENWSWEEERPEAANKESWGRGGEPILGGGCSLSSAVTKATSVLGAPPTSRQDNDTTGGEARGEW